MTGTSATSAPETICRGEWADERRVHSRGTAADRAYDGARRPPEGCRPVRHQASARTIVNTVLDKHVPVVLDTSGFVDKDELDELVAGVAWRLFVHQKTAQMPLLVVLEECHEWLPQRGTNDAKEALIMHAKRGRKRGIGFCGLSQRPADVDKAFVTQCDWLCLRPRGRRGVPARRLDAGRAACSVAA